MLKLEEIEKRIKRLRPFPPVASRMIEILHSEEKDIKEAVRLISYDPAITGMLLRICNSSLWGRAKKIGSVRQAVVQLGIDRVLNMVLMEFSSWNMKGSQSGYDLKEKELWKHSISSAILSEQISEMTAFKENSFIFTASLLKDIGKVVLNELMDDYLDKILEMVKSGDRSFIEAEREIFGIDHPTLGGMVARSWNLPSKMVHLIENHHSEDISSDDKSLSILLLSDYICMMLGIGVGLDGLAYRFYGYQLRRLNITHKDIPEIMLRFYEKMDEIEKLINLT